MCAAIQRLLGEKIWIIVFFLTYSILKNMKWSYKFWFESSYLFRDLLS